MSRRGFTVPPGRAGRLWLIRRLQLARRGADLLDRKLRILSAELGRFREAEARTAAEWDRCCADAERWLLRACMLGGERAVRLGAGGQHAIVTIPYAVTMGVRHPASPACLSAAAVTWEGPTLTRTRQAHAAALAAAVQHAAAAEALRVLEAEVWATRYRLRAIEDRWIPRLEQALAEVTFALEEQELADVARLRLAVATDRRPDALRAWAVGQACPAGVLTSPRTFGPYGRGLFGRAARELRPYRQPGGSAVLLPRTGLVISLEVA